jgi:RimJ/RimL family protein N-acetyltransferase
VKVGGKWLYRPDTYHMAVQPPEVTLVGQESVLATWDTVWPLSRLSLSCGDLRLRPAWDEDVLRIGEVVHTLLNAHEEHFSPNLSMAKRETLQDTTRSMLQWVWRKRAELNENDWWLPFAASIDGAVVGSQDLGAQQFGVLRKASTSSYLHRDARGQGIGLRMRALVAEFAFVHLGAETLRSGHAEGNEASHRISARLGYHDDGTNVFVYKGKRIVERRLVLTRADWQTHRPDWLDDMEVALPSGALDILGAVHP